MEKINTKVKIKGIRVKQWKIISHSYSKSVIFNFKLHFSIRVHIYTNTRNVIDLTDLRCGQGCITHTRYSSEKETRKILKSFSTTLHLQILKDNIIIQFCIFLLQGGKNHQLAHTMSCISCMKSLYFKQV